MALTRERDLDALRPGLESWLGTGVNEITRPAPGWSCETLVVDRTTVIRLPPIGDGIFPRYDLALQAAVQQMLHASGVPVAAPCRHEPDPSFLGSPFNAMPFVTGTIPSDFTPADRWLVGLPDDDARHQVWQTFIDVVARIHASPATGLDVRVGLDGELAFWLTYLDWACDGTPPAALADVFAWCGSNRPDAEPAAGLLWGDVRLGNVVYDTAARTPRAVLDFDMVSAGPIELDVGWFVALENVQHELTGMSVPGFGSRDDTIASVERHVGRPLVDLGWYEVFALARASAISTRISILFARAGQRSMFAVGADPTLAAAARAIEAR
jgi:aminoglycoside phosphotransferase (APT) family kinase protein